MEAKDRPRHGEDALPRGEEDRTIAEALEAVELAPGLTMAGDLYQIILFNRYDRYVSVYNRYHRYRYFCYVQIMAGMWYWINRFHCLMTGMRLLMFNRLYHDHIMTGMWALINRYHSFIWWTTRLEAETKLYSILNLKRIGTRNRKPNCLQSLPFPISCP